MKAYWPFDGDRDFGKDDTIELRAGGNYKLNFYSFLFPFLCGLFTGVFLSGLILGFSILIFAD